MHEATSAGSSSQLPAAKASVSIVTMIQAGAGARRKARATLSIRTGAADVILST
jgi:hypothetical protein